MNRHYYSKDNFMATLGFAAGILGVGYALGTRSKMAKVSERLDKSIDDLAGDMTIDISQEIIDRAVDKAVAVEAKVAVQKATTEVIADLKRDIRNEVSIAVDKEYETIKEAVLKEVTEAAAKINVDRVRRDVERAAERAALEKFDANLDELLRKYNDALTNTGKIYSSIASAMAKGGDSGKEYVFKVM